MIDFFQQNYERYIFSSDGTINCVGGSILLTGRGLTNLPYKFGDMDAFNCSGNLLSQLDDNIPFATCEYIAATMMPTLASLPEKYNSFILEDKKYYSHVLSDRGAEVTFGGMLQIDNLWIDYSLYYEMRIKIERELKLKKLIDAP
jgi:hypothetical protein